MLAIHKVSVNVHPSLATDCVMDSFIQLSGVQKEMWLTCSENFILFSAKPAHKESRKMEWCSS